MAASERRLQPSASRKERSLAEGVPDGSTRAHSAERCASRPASGANECLCAETKRTSANYLALFRSGASRSGEVRPKCTKVDCVSGNRWSPRYNRSCY
jgi:hypothetical protein